MKTAGTDLIYLWTLDGGTTWYGESLTESKGGTQYISDADMDAGIELPVGESITIQFSSDAFLNIERISAYFETQVNGGAWTRPIIAQSSAPVTNRLTSIDPAPNYSLTRNTVTVYRKRDYQLYVVWEMNGDRGTTMVYGMIFGNFPGAGISTTTKFRLVKAGTAYYSGWAVTP